ncbi:hypothetical protein L1987_50122 [Smallanthus sonchifolius]|uniref:Uncharacterized protein n=1 Tax=Smallanthus sonchifolius TaxID=185202 RepID=A0ACB9FX60_9ASTR|nr:hypothetical protein L1987_50122 [Smallanthus sonchifolius]
MIFWFAISWSAKCDFLVCYSISLAICSKSLDPLEEQQRKELQQASLGQVAYLVRFKGVLNMGHVPYI